MSKTLKIYSWNVNGIRAALNKGFLTWLNEVQPDILLLQETKVQPGQVKLELPAEYKQYWNYAKVKKGYSGTAVFSKLEPLSQAFDINHHKHDQEGRVITLELKEFYLVNVYTPNAKRGLERLSYRHQEWDSDFLKYIKELEKKKPVIFGGDLNVAHEEIDLANPKTNHKNAGFTDEERQGFSNYIKAGFVDTFRIFTKESGHYTWWSHFANARARNIGWRIDYFLISKSLARCVTKAWIMPEIMGSDHCPIGLEIKV
ncbi:MAG: exodeoxyribonuclease III [Candidatus Margulisbacteria bacterium]|nr:exodeoxyribonuclease III [Candidatus Margulisiibacteriota bacterium]